MQWIAIDFETANSTRESACSIGVAIVDSGELVHSEAWLIRPADMWFHPMNISVHGISGADVEHAGNFAEVWERVEPLLAGRAVLAHNAGFDIGVLRACCAQYGISLPSAMYACTLSMSRKAFPGLDSHKLNVVADRCGLDLQHHDAESDARACAGIAMNILDYHGFETLADAAGGLGFKLNAIDAARAVSV